MPPPEERLSGAEIAKDAVQDLTVATAGAVGRVTQIVTRAVGEIAGVVGDLATEAFEIRDSARRAQADATPESDADAAPDSSGAIS